MGWIGIRGSTKDGSKPPFTQFDVNLRKVLHLFRNKRNSDAWLLFSCLALHTDQNGWAFPSKRLLMVETQLSKDAVTNALRHLRGLRIDNEPVLRMFRSKKGGKYKGNYYWLFPTDGPVPYTGSDTLVLWDPEAGAGPKATRSGTVASSHRPTPCPAEEDIIKERQVREGETVEVDSEVEADTVQSPLSASTSETVDPSDFAEGEFGNPKQQPDSTPAGIVGGKRDESARRRAEQPTPRERSTSSTDELGRKLLNACGRPRLRPDEAALLVRVREALDSGEIPMDWVENCIKWCPSQPDIPPRNILKWILNSEKMRAWLRGDSYSVRPHAVDACWA
jgi:hypothetical protein